MLPQPLALKSFLGSSGRSPDRLRCLLTALLLCGFAQAAVAGDAELSQEDRIAELERKLEILSDELEKTRVESALPELMLEGKNGFGPAASKVYDIGRGISIGGYAEGRYVGHVTDQDTTTNRSDAYRGVLYVGYKYNDWIVFNSETEVEHASTSKGGSVSLEFAALDFLLDDALNARIGLLLSPMGFLNEVHEPPFYYGNFRPEAERRIIPTTWRENGFGIFGSFLEDTLSYRMYALNGFNAEGFTDAGLRGGRQKGSKALAEDFAFVGRVDWTPIPALDLGASVYVGDSGQDQTNVKKDEAGAIIFERAIPNAQTTIWEVHAQYRSRGLFLRGLFTQAHVADSGQLNFALDKDADDAIASRMYGGYVEAAYNVMPLIAPDSQMSLEPFYRYEFIDTQASVSSGPAGGPVGGYTENKSQDNRLHVLGVNFKPIPQVVLKLDYRNREAKEGSLSNEISVGAGLVF